jgi:hypothetical protein
MLCLSTMSTVHINKQAIVYRKRFPRQSNTLARAIAQAVSRRHPTAAARVRAHVKSCGICGGQRHWGRFSPNISVSFPILIPPTVPHSPTSIIQGWYNRPISGRRTKWTQSHPTPRNYKYTHIIIKAILTISHQLIRLTEPALLNSDVSEAITSKCERRKRCDIWVITYCLHAGSLSSCP